MSSLARPRVGIVGSGVSGLLCAQRLLELMPCEVTVYEWGRGPGGRTARRRATLTSGEEVSFDHAAPFFTATTTRFQEQLADWEAKGVAARWPAAGADAWVGVPSNHAITRAVATDLEAAGATMRFGHHVLSAEPAASTSGGGEQREGGWVVKARSRATGEVAVETFDALVLSDKLLLQPNTYAVLSQPAWGPLELPLNLTSTGAVVLLLAIARSNGQGSSSGGGECTTEAAPPLLVSGAGAAVLNGLYRPRPATEVPAGFAKTCDNMHWDPSAMWHQLARPKERNKAWWLKEDDDSYMYYNFGDGQWWIDGPDGAGLYVAPEAEPSATPPPLGWRPLAGVAAPPPSVAVVKEEAGRLSGVARLTAKEHPFIRLVVQESAKPGRTSGGGDGGVDLYVVHSSAEYAAAHLVGESLDDEASVLAEMQAAALEIIHGHSASRRPGDGGTAASMDGAPPLHASVMAWDHAQPTAESRLQRDPPHLLDVTRRAGLCGDFFAGPGAEGRLSAASPSGVEAAALSGLGLADAMAPLLRI